MALGLEMIQSQKLLTRAGYGSISGDLRSAAPIPASGHQGDYFSSTPVVSLSILCLGFSRQCSLAPAANSKAGILRLTRGHSLQFTSSLLGPNALPPRGKFRAPFLRMLPAGRTPKFRRLFHAPSPETRGCRAPAKTYSVAVVKTPFQLRHVRAKASSIYFGLRMKRKGLEIRPWRYFSSGSQWPPPLGTSFRGISSSTISRRNLHPRHQGGAVRGTAKFYTSSSISSQPEGNGSLENTALFAEGLQERQEQQELQTTSELHGRRGEFLATGYGWRVRDAARGELRELLRIADIQTRAFHERVAVFDEFFFKIFHAEVLSSLQYKARHSEADRYSCLLAEMDPSQLDYEIKYQDDGNDQTIVGAVDCTILTEKDIVRLLPGANEYLYISGMAVDSIYRRRNVATLLLDACLTQALEWGLDYLVLHAYEDDVRARNLYSSAGYVIIDADPRWMTKILGCRQRVVMAKRTHEIL